MRLTAAGSPAPYRPGNPRTPWSALLRLAPAAPPFRCTPDVRLDHDRKREPPPLPSPATPPSPRRHRSCAQYRARSSCAPRRRWRPGSSSCALRIVRRSRCADWRPSAVSRCHNAAPAAPSGRKPACRTAPGPVLEEGHSGRALRRERPELALQNGVGRFHPSQSPHRISASVAVRPPARQAPAPPRTLRPRPAPGSQVIDQELADLQRYREQHRCPGQCRNDCGQAEPRQTRPQKTARRIGRQPHTRQKPTDEHDPGTPAQTARPRPRSSRSSPIQRRTGRIRAASAPSPYNPRSPSTMPTYSATNATHQGTPPVLYPHCGQHGGRILQDERAQDDRDPLRQPRMPGRLQQAGDVGADHAFTPRRWGRGRFGAESKEGQGLRPRTPTGAEGPRPPLIWYGVWPAAYGPRPMARPEPKWKGVWGPRPQLGPGAEPLALLTPQRPAAACPAASSGCRSKPALQGVRGRDQHHVADAGQQGPQRRAKKPPCPTWCERVGAGGRSADQEYHPCAIRPARKDCGTTNAHGEIRSPPW